MDDLFTSDSMAGDAGGAISPNAPLAARFRPRTLEEYIGQSHLLARNYLQPA
jgi:putative ATPase